MRPVKRTAAEPCLNDLLALPLTETYRVQLLPRRLRRVTATHDLPDLPERRPIRARATVKRTFAASDSRNPTRVPPFPRVRRVVPRLRAAKRRGRSVSLVIAGRVVSPALVGGAGAGG